ncbi:MAG: 50S ribosomal protein L5 [Candidatus Thermoplasmatota archaeon]|nr:50S ribosomal protein L5 [Candidatus Thermoplasmatota archaeon]MBS3789861.1 50S ribosomal protein L5 [Candidatus Thermoplasmatota archaeon]
MKNYNPMRKPRLVKCVVNIGVGQGGEKLRKAFDVLEMLTNQQPVETTAETTNAEFGIREGDPIGCKVTLRKKKAYDFLKKAFWVKENRLPLSSFDEQGNLSFGIGDYTDFEEETYDPEIGVFGMDISVEIGRKGQRIKHRRKQSKSIPEEHKMTKKEAKNFMEKAFDLEVYEA